MSYRLVRNRLEVIEPYVKGRSVLDIGCVDFRPGGVRKFKSTGLHIFLKEHAEHTCWYDPHTLIQLLTRHGFEVEDIVFSNKSKWYELRNFFRLKYQIPRLMAFLRPYFSGAIIVVARKSRPKG